MADTVEVVIKIPKRIYEAVQETYNFYPHEVFDAVRNGTVLPKGHDDLVERRSIFSCRCENKFSECDTCINDDLCNIVSEAPTIIKADSEVE